MTKKIIVLSLLAACLLAATAGAAENEAVAKAERAATTWLVLTDGGKFGESWEASSSLLKSTLTKAYWEEAMKAVRAPLGAVKSRKLKSSTFLTTLPGVPPGEYVVIQYDTQFEKKATAIETVTPMRDKDGVWRVSGYYIH